MSFTRKIERNKLKFDMKTNKIQNAWRRMQVNKYGLQGYIDLHNKNCKNKKINTKSIF